MEASSTNEATTTPGKTPSMEDLRRSAMFGLVCFGPDRSGQNNAYTPRAPVAVAAA